MKNKVADNLSVKSLLLVSNFVANKFALLVAVTLLAASAFFVSCHSDDDSSSHEHTFATEWTSDATHHWHAATCEHKDQVKDKAEHNFGDWKTIKEATEEADGLKEKECEICHYAVIEIISSPEHNHEIAAEWTYDENYHWHAADCGKEEHNEGKSAHTWTDGDITKAATETEDGEQALTCECGATSSKVIPALGHQHEIAKIYTHDETHHWYVASCGREEHNEGKAAHNFEIFISKSPNSVEKRIKTAKCMDCGYSTEEEIEVLAHRLGTHHEAVAGTCKTKGTVEYYDCGNAGCTVKLDKDLNVLTSTEGELDSSNHTWNDGEVTKEPTVTEEGVKTFTCTVCGQTKTESIEKLPDFNAHDQPVDATTGLAPTESSTYIYFGVFPKTVLPASSSVTVYETRSIEMGANIYYVGSDNNYYAKVTENAYDGENDSGYDAKYTDGTQAKLSSENSYRYFKVEPIKWKVLTKDYNNTGKALLLADEILTSNVPYFVSKSLQRGDSVYPNNYKYSTIRAYLNGKYESDDSQEKSYENKGFLQTAFTSTAQNLIVETVVDNSVATTSDSESTYATDYACANTNDKIFLLSKSEVFSKDCGYGSNDISDLKHRRLRLPTDYAKANHAGQYTSEEFPDDFGGWWYLRSPFYNANHNMCYVGSDGSVNNNCYSSVTELDFGVVPALCISLN